VFEEKRVLITGGTGSFGHHIVRELLQLPVREIRIFSRDEKKQWDMQNEFREIPNLTFIIGDVRDSRAVRTALRDIDLVFHAAALKQVPNCEYNVLEAVHTNTMGVVNIIEEALEENAERVIAISTDKAVKPVNVMGMTKALQERLLINANLRRGSARTCFACVRYGNVMIPLFKQQIQASGPVTVTHPEMTRFLITLSQAIALVFKAATEAVGGEVYVRKAPAARVLDIAQVMIKHLARDKNIEIRVVGIRPGEKIHEVLVSEEESWRSIETDDDFTILPSISLPSIEASYPNHRRTAVVDYSSTSGLLNCDELSALLTQEGWC
jgi:UDP-N-acetylglucosamine 4,6-dehydratase